MTGLSIFDFDGTLTDKDTFLLFARFVRKRKGMWHAGIKALPAIMAWRLGLKGSAHAKERLFGALYGGMPVSAFKAYGEAFADVVDRNLRKRGMDELNRARERGDKIAICSASVPQWIEPWARRHGIDTVMGTDIEVDADGRLTGRFAVPNCKGPEKVRRVTQIFPDRTDLHI